MGDFDRRKRWSCTVESSGKLDLHDPRMLLQRTGEGWDFATETPILQFGGERAAREAEVHQVAVVKANDVMM